MPEKDFVLPEELYVLPETQCPAVKQADNLTLPRPLPERLI